MALKIQVEFLKGLLNWRSYIPILFEAVREVFGEDVEAYISGSALEDKLTAGSDIDVLIVVDKVPERGLERARIIDAIWRFMEDRGVPWWYPFEIHLVTRWELDMLRRGGAKIADVKEFVR